MTASTPAGVGLAVIAGLMSGNCMLPSKFLRVWRWENMWAAFSLLSLIVLPCGLALGLVHHLPGAFSVYGMSAALLGALGTSIGWGLFQIFMILAANLSGLLTGEWKNTSARARVTLAAGMSLLIVATVLLTAANR